MHFADGTRAQAELVVCADGARSVARELLIGHDDKIYTGRSGFRGLVDRKDLPGLPDPEAIQFWIGPGGHLLHYPIGKDGDVINFLLVKTMPWDRGTGRRLDRPRPARRTPAALRRLAPRQSSR